MQYTVLTSHPDKSLN